MLFYMIIRDLIRITWWCIVAMCKVAVWIVALIVAAIVYFAELHNERNNR